MPAAVDVIASPSARDATGRRICLGVVRPPPFPSLSLLPPGKRTAPACLVHCIGSTDAITAVCAVTNWQARLTARPMPRRSWTTM